MATLIFHSMAGSAYLWTAMMAADEKGVDHALNPVVFGSDEQRSLKACDEPLKSLRRPRSERQGVDLPQGGRVADPATLWSRGERTWRP